mmetsp:Transcript_18723/g.58845  ORF Transcript_18723/g.58845 Transcript_18723/m.58845 type:complete len:261 (-) Transcript_18723:122-904(-)|eukprot:CAMPEP_0204576008 /NCGR_PEP_ID=MMETSP0661-20131031/41522_1 /ASSEMBLY_ACC=CAM_ASM_000606 /TAXON_ID=109239 /ORGANISM="Alexandrium margalefi, Strain AMGDE01CS-322" /LENGTH=260 /DNA_ID=CAMNT_0051584703 /DNA_START=28 /DNA_END=810 /DNA_ORIENTATION=+
MSRGGPTSFDRIFGGGAAAGGDGDKPSVHELFSAAMRDELSLPQFAQALVSLHGVRLTPAALRLLSGTDATSGRLSFAQFQKSLADDSGDIGQAGLPNVLQDQAKAIIEDNLGAPAAPSASDPAKRSTDIAADTFVRQRNRIEQSQARGPFSANPVVRTNRASAGNPLAVGMAAEPAQGEAASEDPYGSREMAHTATRMFVAGDLDRQGYEGFLRRFGVQLAPEAELQRLIVKQGQTGDCKFTDFARALQREIVAIGATG